MVAHREEIQSYQKILLIKIINQVSAAHRIGAHRTSRFQRRCAGINVHSELCKLWMLWIQEFGSASDATNLVIQCPDRLAEIRQIDIDSGFVLTIQFGFCLNRPQMLKSSVFRWKLQRMTAEHFDRVFVFFLGDLPRSLLRLHILL